TDTTSATTTPSFEYNIGSGWVSITTGYLASGDLNDKAVSSSSYTTYTATWHASSQLAATYSNNLQVRVTATDGQGSGQAVTSPIALDTTLPTVASTTLLINGAASAAEATSSAALSLQLQSISGTPAGETIYVRFSNDSSTWYGANSNGTLTTSTTSWGTGFSSAAGTLSSLTWPWSLGGSTLYVQVRDNYGNGPTTDSNTVTGYNQAPQFESLTVSQVSSSNPLAGGLVSINYSIRDTDTTSVTPSFAYSLNSGSWTSISSAAMNSTSTDAKSVASSSYTAYLATWSATSTVTSTYSTDLRVRVTLNDGQVVNNTASSSATITLDSRGPVASSTTLLVNGSSTSVSAVSSTITLSLQNITGYPDNETIYAQFSDDNSTWYGANSNGTLTSSSSWGNGFSSASSTLSSLSWPFAITGRSRTIYTRLTDVFGNNLQSDSNSVGYNVPPEFNSSYGTNGLSVSQNTSSSGSSWGKVSIQYSVRDTDTSVGSSTPGYISPSFEYSVGSGWFPITTSTLVAGDTSSKSVSDSSYTTHSATWHASSQLASTYTSSLQIRVTANDNEPVSNTAQATSSATTLDTKAPATTVRVDARNNRVSVIATDDTSIDSTLSNLVSLASDGSNASSGVWIATNTTSTNTSSSWTLITSSSLNTVYYATRDSYGNTVSGSASAPIAPASTSVSDVSDTTSAAYKELVSWTVYTSTSSAPFSKYEVYRATNSDPNTFSLIGSVTDIAQNYYSDTGLTSSTTYYYKVSIVTTNSDYSAYSPTVSDQPDGLSGAAAQGPTISNVTATEVQASWARITWDTDRVSDSKVEYSITTSSSPYGLSTTTVTLVISHDVYIGDLLPNTQYSYRVVSKDVNNKQTTAAGGTFTTSGGPIISAVTTEAVTDHTASIIWNTNKDANSTVLYSTSLQNLRDGTSTSQAGNAGLVGSPFQHRVTLSGLNTQTIYYYYVKSTDSSSNVSADKNSGNYYTFSTAQDTKVPTISNITVAAVTKNSAVITWQTDEPSNSQLTYDTRSASSSGQAHRNTSLLDDNQTTNHAITLTSLSANTVYYYYVKSIDAAGNLAVSSEQSAQTSDTDTVIIYATGGGSAAPPANSIIKDTTPPVISNVEVSAISAFSARISFDTDEESLGLVSFGESTNYGRTPGESSFRTKHEINLVGLKLGTTYHFQAKASDRGGNFTAGLDDTFTTKFAVESVGDIANLENVEQYQSEIDTLIESVTPSLVTPFVGKIEVSELTENSVIIKWTTNTRTYGSVLYVADKDYDEKKENPYLAEVSDTQTRTTTHQVQLNNLSPGQLYRFKIRSYTLPNVVGWSTERTFTTKSSRIRPDIVRLFNTSFVVTWQTPKQTTSFVEYQNTKTKQIKQSGNDTSVTGHVVNVENLDPDTTYRVRAFGYDANKNIVESETISVTTKKDIVPPAITNLKIDNTFVPGRNDRIQTVISWKTNEPASSLVFYGEGSIASQKQLPNSASSTDAALSTNHNVIITNFKPGTIYQMQVVSVDGAGNRAASPIRVIITPKQTQSVFDVIVKNFEGTFKFINQ
ncbi:MAG: fibronectin type III domain-containing protein, partial [Patescibacteria group bacterium]